MKNPVILFSDQSEKVQYNHPDLPVYARATHMHTYDYEAICHWHPDIEFLHIYSGSMDYFVNGKIVHINEGECIFVNSRRLHYGFSKEKINSYFFCAIVSPSVFPEHISVANSYMQFKFNSNAVDYLVLHPDVPAEHKAMQTIETYYKEIQNETPNPLELLSLGCKIYAEIGDLIPDVVEDKGAKHEQYAFLNMTSYIHTHFAERISLDDIAAAGAMCRSKCCQMFQQQINQTPNNYLTQYRVAKSCEMLKKTTISINEISMQCGFQNPSYFANVFQKLTGQTPRKYRTQNTEE